MVVRTRFNIAVPFRGLHTSAHTLFFFVSRPCTPCESELDCRQPSSRECELTRRPYRASSIGRLTSRPIPPSCIMASGSQRRFTTVHDRAALRVHPDGTRVTAREPRYATQDLRGNRTAVNAGGAGKVKKRKWAVLSDNGTEEPLEEFDIE